PVFHPLISRRLTQHRRWRPETFDCHQRLHRAGKDARSLQGDARAQRMADQRRRSMAERIHELMQIQHVIDHRVTAADRPVGVAVAAQIGRDDMKVAPQLERDPVPIAAMIAPTVHQDREWLVGVAPIHVMQLQPLRIEVVRRRADDIRHDLAHRRLLRLSAQTKSVPRRIRGARIQSYSPVERGPSRERKTLRRVAQGTGRSARARAREILYCRFACTSSSVARRLLTMYWISLSPITNDGVTITASPPGRAIPV